MAQIILNRVAVEKAAATIGIVDRQGLIEHLGMDIEPVSLRLVSTIVTRLPVAMSMAFLYQDGENLDDRQVARISA